MEQKQTINSVTGQAVNVDPLVIFQNSLKTLREMLDVQCSNGNWNYDSYMHGMANGMIFALSLFDNKSPEYLKAPEVWLCDIPNNNKLVAESET
jgi:hypothetical protein